MFLRVVEITPLPWKRLAPKIHKNGVQMMECRDTGLPMNEPEVFKAYCAWRTNAKEFARTSGLDENYPVQVAQIINGADPASTELMKLAMLMSVPESAWSILEKRFSAETVARLDEAWKHVHTGYTYVDEAGDDVKGLALAAAIKSFDKFIADADRLGQTMSMAQMGKPPQEILSQIMAPECKMYERMAGRISGTPYPALEALYAEKLVEYREARQQQNEALLEIGFPVDDDDDNEALNIPFESQGLFDTPEIREAYELLTRDTRVDMHGLAAALSVARLLTELAGEKDAGVIAAGMIDAGLPRRNSLDNEFLNKKFSDNVMGVLENYDIHGAYTDTAKYITQAPPAVRQLAVAGGIVMLDLARKQGENILEYIELRSDSMPAQLTTQMKVEQLEPLQAMTVVISQALSPIMGKTGCRQLEQIFDAQVKDVRHFIASHMPEAPGAESSGGRITFRHKKPGPDIEF
jgi:hypothetical protein